MSHHCASGWRKEVKRSFSGSLSRRRIFLLKMGCSLKGRGGAEA